MDMEWGVDERTNKVWLLQARPETVWSKKNKEKGEAAAAPVATTTDRKVIVKAFRQAQAVLPAKLTSSSIRLRLLNLKTAKSWLRP